jgi:5'-deoxynucleotidase YfbR-like HD superfamily hydrolase
MLDMLEFSTQHDFLPVHPQYGDAQMGMTRTNKEAHVYSVAILAQAISAYESAAAVPSFA